MSENLPQVIEGDIVDIQPSSVNRMKQQVTLFKEFVQSQLQQGVDHGIIPGTNKPSLFKAGAEKLCRLFNLGSRIISHKEIERFEDEYVRYDFTVEVFNLRTGTAIAQGIGSANSAEKKYQKTPLPDLINTLQKMAWKRAYVAAVLTATGASDFFTQDVEDTHDHSHRTPPKTIARPIQVKSDGDTNYAVSGPTEKQLKRLFAISKKSGWTHEDVRDSLAALGLESTKDLNHIQYEKLCENMERYPKQLDEGSAH